MALINDPDNLFQGGSTSVTDAVWGSPTGVSVTITSAGAGLPAVSATDYFEVRDHSQAVNNGLYKATGTPTTSSITADKVTGSAPIAAGSEAVTTLGKNATRKNIHYDTAARLVYLLEKNGLDAAGVLGQTVYSKMMIDWKDDPFLIANAPFPMLCIDADAGKYFIGQDASGNNSGWSWADSTTYSIRTRKLLRSMGWSEITSAGITKAIHSGCGTLGAFEDPTNDLAYYQFGTDTTVDDTVNFTFAGPVNEAVKTFDEIGNPPTCTFATSSTITRASGSFVTDGYKNGGRVTIRAAGHASRNGTFTLTAVAALTLTVSGTPYTTGADATAQLAVDNLNKVTLRLRIRDADPNGKTFAQANLASGGETLLSNRVFKFPLANASDLKISASDATIDGSSPYTGMTVTYYATPQSLGGSGVLVGGPYNFGIAIEANGGTNVQVYEWIQRQLRRTTDIDADADVGIGRTLDGLMRFVGDALQVGSVDGGLTFPTNPDGGGSGVFIANINAASKNFTTYYDNTAAVRSHPVSVPVTLDFNATLEADASAKFTLYFDRTIRTSVTDLVITAGAGANGTMTSAGGNLPNNAELTSGDYVRVAGLTGGNLAMNGVYFISTETTPGSSWAVTRYDGSTITTTSSATANVDQHPVDSPDAVIVDDDLAADVTGLVSGTNYAFSFDYSNNAQGGRTPNTEASVIAKAIGQSSAQYAQSTVQTIQSGVALTIPVTAAQERNFNNP
jgi:hypothetical protein